MITQSVEIELVILEDESLADVGGGTCINSQ